MLNNIYYSVDMICLIILYVSQIFYTLLIGVAFLINTIEMCEGYTFIKIRGSILSLIFLSINIFIIDLLITRVSITADRSHSIAILSIVVSSCTGNDNFCDCIDKDMSVW